MHHHIEKEQRQQTALVIVMISGNAAAEAASMGKFSYCVENETDASLPHFTSTSKKNTKIKH